MTGDSRAVVSDMDSAAAVFAEVRPRLFGIAYRMLGSPMDAEDIVQEVWLRWQAYDRATVQGPARFLATVATRLSINATRSARARREKICRPLAARAGRYSADPSWVPNAERHWSSRSCPAGETRPTETGRIRVAGGVSTPYPQIAGISRCGRTMLGSSSAGPANTFPTERRAPVGRPATTPSLGFLAAAQTAIYPPWSSCSPPIVIS